MATRIVRQDSVVPTTVHAASYARVSTLYDGQNPTLQKRELKETCKRRDWQVIARRLGVSFDSVFAVAKGVCFKELIEDLRGAGR